MPSSLRHFRSLFRLGPSLLALAALAPATARAAVFEFDGATTNVAGGQVVPCIRVAFNPQPEPPGFQARLAPDNLARPVITNFNSSGRMFTLLFKVTDDNGQDIRLFPPGPCRDGRCQSINVQAVTADGTRLLIHVDIASPDGLLDPGTIVGFNPQPEPPGDFTGPDAMEVDFGIANATTATVSATITVLNQSTGRVVAIH